MTDLNTLTKMLSDDPKRDRSVKLIFNDDGTATEYWGDGTVKAVHKQSPPRPGAELYKNRPPWYSGLVYVVRSGGFAKIGYTGLIEERLRALRNTNPHEIKLIALFYGSMEHERLAHEKFKALRYRGEWFRVEGTLDRWIKRGCNTSFIKFGREQQIDMAGLAWLVA